MSTYYVEARNGVSPFSQPDKWLIVKGSDIPDYRHMTLRIAIDVYYRALHILQGEVRIVANDPPAGKAIYLQPDPALYPNPKEI